LVFGWHFFLLPISTLLLFTVVDGEEFLVELGKSFLESDLALDLSAGLAVTVWNIKSDKYIRTSVFIILIIFK